MNLKKWKIGLIISLVSGLLTGLIGLGIDMTWKQILLFVVIAVAKDGQLYLAKHSVDEISFDTNTVTKTKSNEENK